MANHACQWFWRRLSEAGHANAEENQKMDLGDDKAEEEGKTEASARAGAEKKEEAPTHQLSNPARIVPAQESLVSFPKGSRWQPLQSVPAIAGILVLRDAQPGAFENLICLCQHLWIMEKQVAGKSLV